ncbi:MAG: anaerobic C4-dicarboxylate transporter family protein, partial [Phycisphaerae bacterium]
MQAAGGLDLLVMIAERALRANPRRITFIAPIVAYVFTFCSGTGHVAYAILPVIADVARKAGVRPERPLSISVIASQQAITASPLAAATAALLALLDTSKGVGLPQILMICVPSTFFGCMIGALSVYRRGVELNDDPEYRRRLASGEIVEATATKQLTGAERTRAIGSVATFLFAAVLIVAFGLFENLRPTYATATPNVAATIAEVQPDEGPRDEDQRDEGSQSPATETTKVPPQPGADLSSPPTVARTPVSMSVLIQIVMLSAAGIIML